MKPVDDDAIGDSKVSGFKIVGDAGYAELVVEQGLIKEEVIAGMLVTGTSSLATAIALDHTQGLED
jgi:hypothetical protein